MTFLSVMNRDHSRSTELMGGLVISMTLEMKPLKGLLLSFGKIFVDDNILKLSGLLFY